MIPITTNRSYVHKVPLCARSEQTCPYLPFHLLCKQCLSKVELVRLSNLVRKSIAHLLSTVRAIHAPKIICLPKSTSATEHKHRHSLIVLMRLQIEMPHCCRLAKEWNKHRIHLEEKKIPFTFIWAGCRLINISAPWGTRSL